MLRHRAARSVSNHEDLFIQRYQWLMNWALRLTEQDRQQAEDLVHDVFMHFIVSRPSLDRIQQNIDGYLYTMLKNMHLSEVRRTSRIQDATARISDFSLTDYDSVENGLRVLEELSSAQVHAQIRDQLRRLCHYACIRKESSKAGSVLLLRFFHGYYPEEIAQVLRTSRSGVEERLRIARTEARAFLEDPASLSFMNARLPLPPPQRSAANTAEDFMEELRREIYGSREGACLLRKNVERFYSAGESTQVDQRTLSHFVSCPDCLDTVNRVLGLPLLSDRFPMKMMSKDTRKQHKDGGGSGEGPSGAGSGGSDDLLQKVRRKAKDLVNQRPLELRISVNGFILGSQSITSRVNRQTISVKGEERIGFVEIFSEKEVRLLFSCVEPPPDGPIEHKEKLTLSDGRSLEMILDFSSSTPDLHVVYTDPMLGAELAAQAHGQEDNEALNENFDAQERRPRTGKLKPFKRVIENLGRRLTDRSFWLRPGTVTALLALILISAVVFLHWRRTPVPILTAGDLLQRSALAEEAIASRHEQVIHRTLQLEEKSTTGELLARRRIEIWQSADKDITARRLYDEGGALVAGDWRRSDGVQTLYHHGAKPQLQLTPDKRRPETVSLAFDQVWQFEPSAEDFRTLIGSADSTVVEDKSLVYVLNYQGADKQAGIVKATLTLNKADLRATELMLVVRGNDSAQKSENPNSQLREFHFTESTFERRAPSAVAPGIFDPDPDLLSSAKPEIRNAKAENIVPASVSKAPDPAIATPELEVEVLRLLSQAGADLGEQVSVTLSSDGKLRVEGILDTEERKSEILSALSSVANNPAVRIDVNTVAEAVARQNEAAARQQAASPSLEVPVVTVTGTPALQRRLEERFPNVEERAAFVNQVLTAANAAMAHTWALRRLSERYTQQDVARLSRPAQQTLELLIRDHVAAVRQKLETEKQLVAPLLPPPPAAERLAAPNDWRSGVTQLFSSLQNFQENAAALFAGSNPAPQTSARDFQHELARLEKQLPVLSTLVSGPFLSSPSLIERQEKR